MIRKATDKDIPAIMTLLGEVNDVHAEGRPDLFIKGHTKYTPGEVLKIISDSLTPVFVYADESGDIEGYCFCVVQDHTSDPHLAPVKTLYIDDLCVLSSCRGKHIGKKLYDFVCDYAKKEGFHNLTLNVWSCNPSAIRFYEKMGLIPYKIGMEKIL